MTERTHDLAAFTGLTLFAVRYPVPEMTLATAFVALAANMLGGIAPDLDQPTAGLWQRIPAGSIVGRIVHPLLGTHRLISHSIVGMGLFGYGLFYLLERIKGVLMVDMTIVWWAFMIGYASHLIMDTITKEGVPWLFPIPVRIGFPPFKFLRLTTAGMIEKSIIFPGLLVLNGYLVYKHYATFLAMVTKLVR